MRFGPKDDHYEANVWPAVTDSILLIASIFIVLSVVSMLTVAKKLHDYQFEKTGHEGTVCVAYSIPEDLLFKSGESTFFNPDSARREIKKVLKDVATRRTAIVEDARAEFGDKQFYLVLEVAGHTDETWQGSDERTARNQNWKLSAERAYQTIQVVEDIVRADASLKSSLDADIDAFAQPEKTVFRATGYCYSLPRRPTYDAQKQKLKGELLRQARAENRRVEIRLFAQPIKVVHLREDDGA